MEVLRAGGVAAAGRLCSAKLAFVPGAGW